MNSADKNVIFFYTCSNNRQYGCKNQTQHKSRIFGGYCKREMCSISSKKFHFVDLSLQNDLRGRPKLSMKNVLQSWMKMNPNETTNELAVRMKVNQSTILRHLSAIRKVQKIDKWVLHELIEWYKLNWLNVCSLLLTRPLQEAIFIIQLSFMTRNGFCMTIGKDLLDGWHQLMLRDRHFIHKKL